MPQEQIRHRNGDTKYRKEVTYFINQKDCIYCIFLYALFFPFSSLWTLTVLPSFSGNKYHHIRKRKKIVYNISINISIPPLGLSDTDILDSLVKNEVESNIWIYFTFVDIFQIYSYCIVIDSTWKPLSWTPVHHSFLQLVACLQKNNHNFLYTSFTKCNPKSKSNLRK